jgi:hypothetical protein
MVTFPSRRVLSLLSLVFLLHINLDAQTTISGSLTGVVSDQSGAVVPDAHVEVKDRSKGTIHSTKTDGQGVYWFFFLGPSQYTLTVSHEGFRPESRAVDVLLGVPGTLNMTLEVAKANTEILVTGEAPLVQAENGNVSATINHKQISELPNPGNDLTYIAQTAPGVVMNTDVQSFANFSILGMPGTSYRFTIDGTNNSDNGTNFNRHSGLGLFLGQNQIEEATIVSTGYSAQFGGAAGGDINYISKSGTNAIHGNAQYFWNGRVLNANNWFNNAAGNPRPIDIENQWAASIGAPLQKDELFFFFDSEGVRLLIPQFSTVVIPSPEFEAATMANIDADSRFGPNSATHAFYRRIFYLYNAAPGADRAAAGGFDLQNDPTGCGIFLALPANVPCSLNFLSNRSRASSETLTSGRMDWNISQRDRAFLRAQYDHGLGAFFTDTISPLFDADFDVSWWQGSVIETHTFGSTAANQFLAAASYWAPIYKVANFPQARSAFPTVLDFGAIGSFTNLGGRDGIGDYGRFNRQYQLSEDFVRTRGNHKLGMGANFERTWWTTLPVNVNTVGQLTPVSLNAFYQGGLDPSSPSSDFTLLTQSFTSQKGLPISFFNLGMYGEDEWRAKPDLAVTLGLRVEHYSNPVCRTRCFARLRAPFDSISHDPDQPYDQAISTNQEHAFFETDQILWSPRFSFAWQPFSVSRNTVLRGGFGLFYDGLPGIEESFYLNAPQYNVFTTFGDNLTPNEKPTNLFQAATTSNDAFVNAFATGQTLAQIQAAIPNFFPPTVTASVKTLHSPQFQKWSLELQHAFGAQISVNIGYFGNHGVHELVLNNSANAFGFGTLPRGLCSNLPILPCADPRFSQIVEDTTIAISNYNGMVISFKSHFAGFGSGIFQVHYTYGHAFDEVSNGGVFSFTSVGLNNPQNPGDLRGSYGPAEYDVRHSFNANYVWEIPVKLALRSRRPKSLMDGWQISGTIFARTGFPYTVIDAAISEALRQNNYFGVIYAVPARPLGPGSACGRGAAFPLAPQPCQQPQTLSGTPNPNANFVQAGCETGFDVGNLPGSSGPCSGPAVSFAQGRNRFRGSGYFNTDLAITKKTRIPGCENATLAIGLQFFNLFNHPNFGFPDSSISSTTFGQIFYLEQSPTSILGTGLGGDASPRMIQVKAQLQF